MSRILVITDVYPNDLTNGRQLRDFYICRELCRYFDCYLFELSRPKDALPQDDRIDFKETRGLGPRPKREGSLYRIFRLSDARYLQKSRPEYFRQAMTGVQQFINDVEIDAVLNLNPKYSEISAQLSVPCMLDYPDSSILAINRVLQNTDRKLSLSGRFDLYKHRFRQIRRDRTILPRHKFITTISKSDAMGFGDYRGKKLRERIFVVPNGVSEDAYSASRLRTKPERSIVFWGNLAFPPNWTSVSYFYRNVFLPHLAEADIDWHIIGGGASDEIEAIGNHPRIHLAGFVEDLYGYVANMGLMINPMQEGGGLKNKVLEAFALGMPVVTTTMGVDAIDARDDEHVLVADDAGQFADAIKDILQDQAKGRTLAQNAKRLVQEKYSWSAIGEQYRDIVERMLADGSAR